MNTIHPDGTGDTLVLRDARFSDWSPDGTKMLVVTNSGSKIADADGSNLVDFVADPPGTAIWWQPRHPNVIERIAGEERIATAIEASRAAFDDRTAGAVVLARADAYADALAGTPLAVARSGPLLLTPPDRLDERVEGELRRVLRANGEVVLLGGDAALRPAVERRLNELGYRMTRFAGADRFETAVAIAHDGLGDPGLLLLTTGYDFADAVTAGAAAGANDGAVLLTAGPSLPDSVRAYLAAHPAGYRVAIGGPAAKASAAPDALVGEDRYETAVLVAAAFFVVPGTVGIADGTNFADALAAGPVLAREGAPLLLSRRDVLPSASAIYLFLSAGWVDRALVFGGPAAVDPVIEGVIFAHIS